MRSGTRRGPVGASEVMIGRQEELRRLVELAGGSTAAPGGSAAAPGGGITATRVALLAGEPGIGKTRLTRELVRALPAATTILVGGAEPGSLGRPFELLLSALDGRADVDPTELDALVDAGRTQVERLRIGLRLVSRLTSAEQRAGGGPPDRTPAVVIFEDLHWADSESIALFERIADLEGAGLLIGTYRPAEVSRRNPVAGLLDRLERRHAVYHVQLDRWTLAETSAYLAAVIHRPPPYRAAVALHHRTGGNPFFLEELLRGVTGDDLETLCERPLPWSLAETLRRQVEDLEPAHQRLVEAAAVLGNRVPFDLLAAVSGLPEADLIWALRELVRRGILTETGDDEFAFRHALVREATEDRLLGRERRRLHEAALDALLAGDGRSTRTTGGERSAGRTIPAPDWALLAKHARGAGRYPDMLRAARDGSEAYLAMGSAFQALQLAELGLEEDPDDLVLLRNAARAAWLAGLSDDADAYAERWLATSDTPDDTVEAMTLRIRLAAERGDEQAMSRLSAAVSELVDRLTGPAAGLARARAGAILAFSARMRDLDDEALLWADRTVELADALSASAAPPEVEAVRLAALGEKGALLVGRVATLDAGRALLTEVAARAEAAGEWLVAATALNKLVHAPPAGSVREIGRASGAEQRAHDANARSKERAAQPRADAAQSEERAYGARNEIAVLLERMRAAAERSGSQRLAVAAYYQGRARLFMQKGNLAAATDAIERGRAHDLGYRRSMTRSDIHGVFLAGLRLEADDLAGAQQVIDELVEVPGLEIALPGLRFHLACRRHDVVRARALLPDLVAVVQSTGGRDGGFLHDLVTAAVVAPLPTDEISKLVDGLDGPAVEPSYRRLVAGQLAEAGSDLDTALAHYLAASDASDLPPAARGTAHVGVARTLLAGGEIDEASAHATWAGELLARWSGWRVTELEAVRRRLAPDTPGAGGLVLTPREREVAQLVADGLTNAELAQRLFISPRTAAVHVSNILRKLGVSSRTDVAHALAEL